MANEKALPLEYKGRPLRRKGNLIYYGSMSDKYIIMMQVLSTKTVGDMEVADQVLLQLQLTDESLSTKEKIVKKSEKNGLYAAMDFGSVWLERALAGK